NARESFKDLLIELFIACERLRNRRGVERYRDLPFPRLSSEYTYACDCFGPRTLESKCICRTLDFESQIPLMARKVHQFDSFSCCGICGVCDDLRSALSLSRSMSIGL